MFGFEGWVLTATYVHMGREQVAKELIAEYMKRKGWKKRTVKMLLKYCHFKDPADKDRLLEGLRKAGLPETISFWDIRPKTGEK